MHTRGVSSELPGAQWPQDYDGRASIRVPGTHIVVTRRRNQDQNENQTITDGEIVRLCKLAVDDFLAGVPGGKQAEMPLAQLVASACNHETLQTVQAAGFSALDAEIFDLSGFWVLSPTAAGIAVS